MYSGSQQEIRILHVDDDPSITDLTATFLEREDHRFLVETAASADEGLQLLAESEIDCIISDYDMPGTNGIEFLESVAKEYPDLPFILYTGKGSEEIASKAITAGVTDYLQKESGTDHYSLLANRVQHATNSQRRKQRIEFFEILEKLSINFLQSEGPDIDILINRTLERIGTIVNAGRTYVFEIDHEAETLSNTHEWCSEDVEPQIDMLQDISQDTVPWWIQKLKNFENIAIPNVSELPPEAEAAQELLEEQNIVSLIVTPMISDDKLVGFIGFDWVEEQEPWSDEFISILRMVSELIMAARQRNEQQQELEKSDTIIEALGDAVYVIDEEGQFTYINDEFVELVGYNRERILGSTPSLIKSEETVEQAEHQLGRLLSSDGPKTVDFEATIRPRSGNPVVCEDHMSVLPYDGEEFDGSVGTLRDMTDQKEREQELEKVQNQYETVINNFPNSAVYVINADLRCVRAGGEELRRAGPSLDDVEGKKPHTLFPEEIADELCRYYEESLDKNANTFEQEYAGKRYQVQTVPVRTDGEEVECVMAVSQSVSERVEDKRELERQNERLEEYRTLLETVKDSIFFLTVDSVDGECVFRFKRLNRAYEEQTGITTDEVRGKTPTEVFGEDIGADLRTNYRRCVQAGEPISYEEEVPTETGARFWETVLTPVITNGEVTQIIGITRNMTERVKQERQLQSQTEQLNEFASVVSHDLRNPLSVAQGRVELLATDCDSEHLSPVIESLDRMEEIVADTLTLARQGQVVSDPEPVELDDIVGVCWENVQTDEATIEIENEVTIVGDRSRLQHIFENLFRNALEHGGPAVTARVGKIDGHGIYVEDTGPGIPEDIREAVFDAGHTSTSDGTGFGLTIVKRIAEAHGWQVTAADGSDGGARIEFTDVDFD